MILCGIEKESNDVWPNPAQVCGHILVIFPFDDLDNESQGRIGKFLFLLWQAQTVAKEGVSHKSSFAGEKAETMQG